MGGNPSAKFSGGGGDVVHHSRVCPPQGSLPAIAPRRSHNVRTTFQRNGKVEMPSRKPPTDDTRLRNCMLPISGYDATRRGIPSAPRTCCTRNVRWNPTNVSQKWIVPRRRFIILPVIFGNQW